MTVFGEWNAATRTPSKSSSTRRNTATDLSRAPSKSSTIRTNTFLTEQPDDKVFASSCQDRAWIYEDPAYYTDLSLGPGIEWIKALIRSDNGGPLLASFNVNFPETFCFLNHERYMLQQRQKGEKLGVKLFHECIEEKDQFARRVGTWGEGEDIVCVKKVPSRGKTNTSVLKTYTFNNFFDDCIDPDAVFQRYIAPKNGSSAAVCRIAWNAGYRMSGWYVVTPNSSLVISDNCDTQGFKLKTVPSDAQVVVNEVARVTQQFSGIRMKQIIVDLIRDKQGVWWFIQVKAFTLHEQAKPRTLAPDFLPGR